jgi:drug/metabolite transporter (DMT)-like permease
VADERLHGAQWAAIGLIGAGGAVLTFGARQPAGANATVLALLAAVLIAAYTLVDGIGVRRSGSPAAYTCWILMLGAVGAVAVSWRSTEGRLPAYVLRRPGLVLLGGVATTGSYAIALWAMTLAPVAVVAALRETSIVFATAIAALVLRERMTRARVAGAGIIALGAVAMRLA